MVPGWSGDINVPWEVSVVVEGVEAVNTNFDEAGSRRSAVGLTDATKCQESTTEAKGQQRRQEDADGERRGVCGNQGEQRGGSPVAQAYKDVEIITLRTRE